MTAALRPTYKRAGQYWHGAIKLDGKVVWVCPHSHHNRDQSSLSRGTAARDCAKHVVSAYEHPEWPDAVRKVGARPGVIADVDHAEAAAAELRALLGEEPAYEYIGPYRCNAFARHAHNGVEHQHDGGALPHRHPLYEGDER
jgi:hypothetical protein